MKKKLHNSRAVTDTAQRILAIDKYLKEKVETSDPDEGPSMRGGQKKQKGNWGQTEPIPLHLMCGENNQYAFCDIFAAVWFF